MTPDYEEPDVDEAPEVAEVEEVDANDEPDAPPEPEVPAHDPDVEAEARFLGWKPETEWKGEKPPGFISDPNEFLQRWENVTPVRRLRERMERESAAADEKLRKLESLSERALERQRKDYEARLGDLAQKRREAVETGDVEAYDRLEKQERALRDAAPERERPEQPKQPAPDPAVVAYVEANDWAKDPALWAEAAQTVNFMPGLQHSTPQQQLEFAEAQMKRRYPHLFQPEPARQASSRVDGGGLGAAKRSGFATLPSEAKATFKRFAKEGLYEDNDKGRQEFFDEYDRA